MSSDSPEASAADTPSPDPDSIQVPLSNTHVALGRMMGLAFLLTLLIVIWRLGSSTHSVAAT